MIKNYFIIAWRTIVRNKISSAINITGLAAGIAVTLLIAAYVRTELQANKSLKNAARQYIIQTLWKDPGQGLEFSVPGPLAKALKESCPHLVAGYYRYDGLTTTISKGDKHFKEIIQVGDSSLLSMFGFPLLHGDPNTALRDPFSVVISEEMAVKYFGRTDVVGETLNVQDFSAKNHDFIIGGVLKKLPLNTVTRDLMEPQNIGFFFPKSNYFNRDIDSWQQLIQVMAFVELREGVEPEALAAPMQRLLAEHLPPEMSKGITEYLVPLEKYYLVSNNGTVKKMLYTLSGIALFILLMAVVNFVNISVSKAGSRIKEIGIRKVLGTKKKELILQFLVESNVLVLLSACFALFLYHLVNPWFGQVLGKELPPLAFFTGYIPQLLAFVLFTGCLAGIYPAFVLSSLPVIDSIKGKLKTVREHILLRKMLVGFQFVIATVAFVGVIIISGQVSLFFSDELGYEKDYVLSAQVPRDWTPEGLAHMESVRNEFSRLPQVSHAALSWDIPNGNAGGTETIYRAEENTSQPIHAVRLSVDEGYAATYQLKMLAGNFFRKDDEQLKVVINEAAAKALGWNDVQAALGGRLRIPGWYDFTVCGVVSDFHFGTMQEQIKPLIFLQLKMTSTYRYLSFKIKPGNTSEAVAALQEKWAALMPGAPFEYRFMDTTLEKLYRTELQLKKAAYTAAMLSLVITLLGVLGLVSLSIQKKTKEIGIRKVLGASVKDIIFLFLKEFLPVIVVAGIVACPVAYRVMQYWLNDYAYRITITAAPFVISTLVLIGIVTLTISLQTLRIARENPVKSLRTE